MGSGSPTPYSPFPTAFLAVLFRRGERGDLFVRAAWLSEYPNNGDADEVESEHRRGEDDHIEGVGRRRQNRSDDGDNHHGVTPCLPHYPRSYQPDPSEQKCEGRNLKDYAEADHNHDDQIEVPFRVGYNLEPA